jgi:hypothetical protein
MGPIVADIGVRTFSQVNSTLSQLTGVPINDPTVNPTYISVQQQLPSVPTLEAFSAANQVGTAQLAIQYCNTMVKNSTLAQQMFGVTLSATTYPAQTNTITSALAARVLGGGSLPSQPALSTVTTELSSLITTLCSSSACNNLPRVQAVTAAACAAAFGSADMSIN